MGYNYFVTHVKFNNIFFGGGHVIHYSYFWTEWKKKTLGISLSMCAKYLVSLEPGFPEVFEKELDSKTFQILISHILKCAYFLATQIYAN